MDRLKHGKLNGSSGHKSMLFTVASIFAKHSDYAMDVVLISPGIP